MELILTQTGVHAVRGAVPVLPVPLEDLAGGLRLHRAHGGLGGAGRRGDEHLDGGGHLAMALCRPGRPEITDDDDAWVDALSEVLDDQIDGTWSLHLAAEGNVLPLVDLSA